MYQPQKIAKSKSRDIQPVHIAPLTYARDGVYAACVQALLYWIYPIEPFDDLQPGHLTYTIHLPQPFLPDHPIGFILAQPQYTATSHIPRPFMNPLPAVTGMHKSALLCCSHNLMTATLQIRRGGCSGLAAVSLMYTERDQKRSCHHWLHWSLVDHAIGVLDYWDPGMGTDGVE